jgi:hypothetical protein
VNPYNFYKIAAISCVALAGLVNVFLGVGNSLFMMLAAIYFQLCAMEYAEKEQVQA